MTAADEQARTFDEQSNTPASANALKEAKQARQEARKEETKAKKTNDEMVKQHDAGCALCLSHMTQSSGHIRSQRNITMVENAMALIAFESWRKPDFYLKNSKASSKRKRFQR